MVPFKQLSRGEFEVGRGEHQLQLMWLVSTDTVLHLQVIHAPQLFQNRKYTNVLRKKLFTQSDINSLLLCLLIPR